MRNHERTMKKLMTQVWSVLILLLILAGCDNATSPNQDHSQSYDMPETMNFGDAINATMDEQSIYTAPGFYFLAPLVKDSEYSGTFDAELSPVVEICETTECVDIHESFDMDGNGSERVRVDEVDEHYIVNWSARSSGASAGETYRIRVMVDETKLGHADVHVVRNGREANQHRSAGEIAIVSNQTLPVKFRIETGIVGAINVIPAEETIDVGETQQFSAELYDLHGEPLIGPAVNWSIDDTGVATIDMDGLATGVDEGVATIIAGAGPAIGTALLTVSETVIPASWHDLNAGIYNTVHSLTVYDGDLIAGGVFNTAGGETVNNIARWDGSTWQPLGTGTNSTIFSLTVHDGDLIAGGAFDTAGGESVNHIARWDGSTWQPLGTGMNFSVTSLTVHDGDLIAGGNFTSAGGETANRVARWDGSAWQPIGTGMNDSVEALMVHNGDLIAGGYFSTADGETVNNIARWDGSEWQPMSTGMNSLVRSLTVYDGDLIAGGAFDTAGGETANHIARWDGSAWQPIGTGMSSSGVNILTVSVRSLTVYNGDLIAGGDFETAGGETVNNVARWDGSAWQSMDTGMNNLVLSLTVYNGDLIAGGDFTIASGEAANGVARWGTP